MKMKLKLAALLTGAVLAISALSIPAGAAATLFPPSADLMYERIAEWENTAADECIAEGKIFLTPTKPYSLSVTRRNPCRVTCRAGTAPDPEAILAAFKKLLTESGWERDAEQYNLMPEVTENGDGTFSVTMESWRWENLLPLPDVLAELPEITRIEAKYRFHTDSRPNSQDMSMLWFESSRTLTAADFPELDIESLEYREDDQRWILKLDLADQYEWDYPAYFEAYKMLRELDFVRNLYLRFSETELYDASEDATIETGEWETVFYRGDMNGDNRLNVADAVLLAQLAGEVPDAGIPAAGFINADTDGDGLITSADIRTLLLLVIEENLQT